MISLDLAHKLKDAGLVWRAGVHDFFAIPDRNMDDRIFVLTDIMAYQDIFKGWPVVTFHGTSEWALDYIVTTEVIWIPTEEQLRQELADIIADEPEPQLQLSLENGRYRCTLHYREEEVSFTADSASHAYGETLLYLLKTHFSRDLAER